LDVLVGSEAKQAIATYRSGPPETDSWLQDSLAEPTLSAPLAQTYTIRRLKSKRDLDGLVGWLRDPADPKMRQEAALALRDMGNMDATEWLIRAHLEDPDEDVRKIARQAVDSLVGSQADLAISAYRSGPAEKDPWLLARSVQATDAPENEEEWEELTGEDLIDYLEQSEQGEDGEEEDDEELADVPEGEPGDEESLHGLITVLQTSKDPAMRQRAFQLLLRSHNIHAVWYMAQTALYSDDPEMKDAANAALNERFGDEAAGILQGYKEGNLIGVAVDKPDEEEDEEDEEEDEESEETGSPFQQSPSLQDFPQPQVIHEEGMNWRLILIAALVVLAAAAVIILLSSHG
jgi:HEAT repeat protein